MTSLSRPAASGPARAGRVSLAPRRPLASSCSSSARAALRAPVDLVSRTSSPPCPRARRQAHPPAPPRAFDDALFAAATAADEAVRGALGGAGAASSASSSLSPASLAVVWAAGVATSLSPCTLSVLPLTLGYLSAGSGGGGGGEEEEDGAGAPRPRPRRRLPVQALAFSAGLATTLAGLGVASALAGKAYGTLTLAALGGGQQEGAAATAATSAGAVLPVAAGVLAVVSGLALLDALPPRWSAAVLWALRPPPAAERLLSRAAGGGGGGGVSGGSGSTAAWPRLWRAYAAGLVAALAASPCATPVLASILAWVSATRDPAAGGVLLLCYSSGYVAPLLVAGAVAELGSASAVAVGGGGGGDRGGEDDGGKAASAARVTAMLGGGGGGGGGGEATDGSGSGSPRPPPAPPATLDPVRSAVRAALASGAPEALSRASGFMLVAGGVYAVLSRVVPG